MGVGVEVGGYCGGGEGGWEGGFDCVRVGWHREGWWWESLR